MLRVLSPAEQSCLTTDAQALIYRYCSKNWLTPRQLEDLITSVVGISRIRHFPADEELVTFVLRSMGDPESIPLIEEDAIPTGEKKQLLS